MSDGQRRLSRTGRLAGPGVSVIKYDILTALLVTAARGGAVEARLSQRLALLITARFNWRSGTFAVAQKEMARLWGVTERTAKREMAEMRVRGWVVVAVPSARGRVAEHRIVLERVLADTRAHWDAVGPDFVARMSQTPDGEGGGNVVPLRPAAAPALPEDDAGTGWADAAARLRDADPATYAAWFAGLQPVERSHDTLTLIAPSRFVASYVETHFSARLLAAMAADGQGVREIRLVWAD